GARRARGRGTPARTAPPAAPAAGRGRARVWGGAPLRGGRMPAAGPGQNPADLHQNRDLAATTDLRAVMKGVLKDHLRLDDQALATAVFPGSSNVKPMAELLA